MFEDPCTWKWHEPEVKKYAASDDLAIMVVEPDIVARAVHSDDIVNVVLIDPDAGGEESCSTIAASDSLTVALRDDDLVLCMGRGEKWQSRI